MSSWLQSYLQGKDKVQPLLILQQKIRENKKKLWRDYTSYITDSSLNIAEFPII